MNPDQLLREFLKATADPANRHLAARQFLTESASKDWDDQGSALLIDNVVFTESRSLDTVSVTMQADILGSLSDIGVFETGEGQLPDPGPIELVQTSDGWRINRLPNGFSWTGNSSSRPTNATLCTSSIPRVRRWFPTRVMWRSPIRTCWLLNWSTSSWPDHARRWPRRCETCSGPVEAARSRDPGRRRQDRGRPWLRGAQIDLENLTTTDPASRTLLAAQLIWTLARADIKGPYVINADGAPGRPLRLWAGRPRTWRPPTPAQPTRRQPGHALMGGSMVTLDGQQATKVPGSFGELTDQRSAAFSRTGRDVASVTQSGRDSGSALWMGPNGGQAVRAIDGHELSRPSWALDDAVWVVVDGNSVVRVIKDEATGQPARIPVDTAAVISRFPGLSPNCSFPGIAPALRW